MTMTHGKTKKGWVTIILFYYVRVTDLKISGHEKNRLGLETGLNSEGCVSQCQIADLT